MNDDNKNKKVEVIKDDDEMVIKIPIEDIQYVAESNFGRRLTEKEVKNMRALIWECQSFDAYVNWLWELTNEFMEED